jgi:hypothetical protein
MLGLLQRFRGFITGNTPHQPLDNRSPASILLQSQSRSESGAAASSVPAAPVANRPAAIEPESDGVQGSDAMGGWMAKRVWLVLVVLSVGLASADFVVKNDGARVKCTIDSVGSQFVWTTMPDGAQMAFLLADVVSLEVGTAARREALERALGRSRVSVVLTGDAEPAAPPVKKESLPAVPAETSAKAGPQVVVTTSADTLVVIRPQFVPTTTTESTLAGLPMVVEPTKPETTLKPLPEASLSLETRRHIAAAGKYLRDAQKLGLLCDALLVGAVLTSLVGTPFFVVLAVGGGIGALVAGTKAWSRLGEVGDALQEAAGSAP